MENKIIKEKPQIDTKDWHKLSFCDIRYPVAQKISDEIERVSKTYKGAVQRARQDLFGVLARLPAREDFNADQNQEVELLCGVITELKRRCHEELTKLYKDLRDVALVRQFEFNNLIPTAGRAVMAKWLSGDDTYPADTGVNYGSLGSSNTAPTNADTKLTTEIYRKATSSATTASNICYLSNFYTATEVSGTIEEAGWHIVGSATVNSGQLTSHFLTGTVSKLITETLTVESALTIV